MLDLGKRVSIYQPEQEGLIFPELPEFASVAGRTLPPHRSVLSRHAVHLRRPGLITGLPGI